MRVSTNLMVIFCFEMYHLTQMAHINIFLEEKSSMPILSDDIAEATINSYYDGCGLVDDGWPE